MTQTESLIGLISAWPSEPLGQTVFLLRFFGLFTVRGVLPVQIFAPHFNLILFDPGSA